MYSPQVFRDLILTHTGERPSIVARRARWSDQASAEGEHACVSAGVTRREFQRPATLDRFVQIWPGQARLANLVEQL
jgi:hypothetical protein